MDQFASKMVSTVGTDEDIQEYRVQHFKRNADELERWIKEKLQVASDESNQLNIGKHQAFEAEVLANSNAIVSLENTGKEMISQHLSSEMIERRVEELHHLWESLLTRLTERGFKLQQEEFLRYFEEVMGWIKGKENYVAADEFGQNSKDFEVLKRKVDEFQTDIASQEHRVTALNQLAEKLLQSGLIEREIINAKKEELFTAWERLKQLSTSRQEIWFGEDKIKRVAKECEQELNESDDLCQFLADLTECVKCIDDLKGDISADELPKDVTSAKAMIERHKNRSNIVDECECMLNTTIKVGRQLMERHSNAGAVIEKKLNDLKESMRTLLTLWDNHYDFYKQYLDLLLLHYDDTAREWIDAVLGEKDLSKNLIAYRRIESLDIALGQTYKNWKDSRIRYFDRDANELECWIQEKWSRAINKHLLDPNILQNEIKKNFETIQYCAIAFNYLRIQNEFEYDGMIRKRCLHLMDFLQILQLHLAEENFKLRKILLECIFDMSPNEVKEAIVFDHVKELQLFINKEIDEHEKELKIFKRVFSLQFELNDVFPMLSELKSVMHHNKDKEAVKLRQNLDHIIELKLSIDKRMYGKGIGLYISSVALLYEGVLEKNTLFSSYKDCVLPLYFCAVPEKIKDDWALMKAEFATLAKDQANRLWEICNDDQYKYYKNLKTKCDKKFVKDSKKIRNEFSLSDLVSWIKGDIPIKALTGSEELLKCHYKRQIKVYAPEQQWFHWYFEHDTYQIALALQWDDFHYVYEKCLNLQLFQREFEQDNTWINWMDELAESYANDDANVGYYSADTFEKKINNCFKSRSCTQRMRKCDYRELWIVEKLLEPIDTPKEIRKFVQEFLLRQFTLRKFSLLGPRNEYFRDKLEMKLQFLISYAKAMHWMTQIMNETDDEFRKKFDEMKEFRGEMISIVQLILNVNEVGEILLQDDMVEHDSIEKKKTEILDKYKEFGEMLKNKKEGFAEEINNFKGAKFFKNDKIKDKLEANKKQLNDLILLHHFWADFRDQGVSWINNMKAKISAVKLAKGAYSSKTMIECHQKRRDEINKKQSKDFMDMIKEGRQLEQNISDKLKIRTESLDILWEDRNKEFKQCLQLHSFYHDTEQLDTWMAEQEAFLIEKNLGHSLNSVEKLIEKHENFENILAAQEVKIEVLENSAKKLIDNQHYAANDIDQRRRMLSGRYSEILGKSEKRRQALKYEQLKCNLENIQQWVEENMQKKSGMALEFPKNFYEIKTMQNRIENIMATSTYLIEKKHNQSIDISYKKETILKLWDEFTESFQPKCSQSGNVLLVIGITIKISVISALIKINTKYVFVFALHKLIVDADIDIEHAMFIASTWQVNGEGQINLNRNEINGEKIMSTGNFIGIYKRIKSSEIGNNDDRQHSEYGEDREDEISFVDPKVKRINLTKKCGLSYEGEWIFLLTWGYQSILDEAEIENHTDNNGVNDHSHTANIFKCLLRERIVNIDNNNDKKSNFELFLDILEKDEKFRLLYVDTLDLFDDFVCLYNQFHTIKNTSNFTRYFESLRQRISELDFKIKQKAKINTNAYQDKLLELNFLQTTIHNELFNIEKHENEQKYHNKYTNLSAILEDANNGIVNLHHHHIRNQKRQDLNEYKKHLADKIHSAKESIERKIMPELERLIRKAEQKFQMVANDMIKKQDKVQDNIDELEKQKNILHDSLRLHLAINAAKVTGRAVSFFGPLATGIGWAVIGGSDIAEVLVGKKSQNADIKSHVDALKASLYKISVDVKNDLKPLEYITKECDQIVNNNDIDDGTPESKEIANKIATLKSILIEEQSKSGIGDPTQLYQLQKELIEKCNEYKSKLEQKNLHNRENVEKSVCILIQLQSALTLGDPKSTVYSQLKDDQAKMKTASDIISKLREEFKLWNDFEMRVYDIMLPELERFENQLNDHIERNSDQALHELCHNRWSIQTLSDNFMVRVKEMSKESTVYEDIINYMNAVIRGVKTIIEVYGYIEKYKENVESANFTAKMVSNDHFIESLLMSKLKEIIEQSKILDQYKISMRAFVRHYFPFVPKFEMKLNFKSNENKISVNNAKELIKYMQEHHKVKTTTPKGLTFAKFGSCESSDEPPFYVWKYAKNKTEIHELLKGEAVQMEANIRKGVNVYAIKFKKIEIRLKAVDLSQQNELNTALENCDVTLICGTDHRYRYGQKLYTIPMDNLLEFRYTIKNGQATKWNALAIQIWKDDDYFLSPYNTWSIKLEGKKLFEKFKDIEIDIELVGNGKFINKKETVELGSHYDLSGNMVQFAFNKSLMIETECDEHNEQQSRDIID